MPTLIVGGTLDTFTPPRLSKAMHLAIPGSEILFLEGATHGAVIEYPDEVNAAVLDFLDRSATARRRTPAALR